MSRPRISRRTPRPALTATERSLRRPALFRSRLVSTPFTRRAEQHRRPDRGSAACHRRTAGARIPLILPPRLSRTRADPSRRRAPHRLPARRPVAPTTRPDVARGATYLLSGIISTAAASSRGGPIQLAVAATSRSAMRDIGSAQRHLLEAIEASRNTHHGALGAAIFSSRRAAW